MINFQVLAKNLPLTTLTRHPLFSKSVCLVLLFVAGCAAHAKFTDNTEFTPLSPPKEQMQTNALIAYQLPRYHYKTMAINDEVSKSVFDNYLKALDSQKLYFLKSDIDEFKQYEQELDEALKYGQLDPAFRIYNRYQRRVIERLQHSLKLLDKGLDVFDFTKDENIRINRENEPWPETEDQLNDLWRKRVKAAILSLKLTEKKPEEIVTSLKKRYQSQLSRLMQTNDEDAFQVYMNAFTGVFDPHTQYFSPRTSENFNINMSLSLEGIGAVLQTDNEYTKVLRLVPAGPADKQGGLQPADRIIGVGQGKDGEMVDVVGWRLDEVVDLIRGPKQTLVKLQVIPAESKDETMTKQITIVRDKVSLEEQAAQSSVIEIERDGKKLKFGVINLPTFYADFRAIQRGDSNARRTSSDVQRLLGELLEDGIDGLIIDLRNNGGGSLGEANSLTGLFIDQGPTVQIRYARGGVEVLKDPQKGLAYEGPMAVLVNRMSASASEIFAGAMQDYGRAIIIGDQTFGKGTVQQIRPLKHGQLKLTQAKFYRVSGASTQHKGVLPDIIMPSPIDKEAIGEDTLPQALPWDRIKQVDFDKNETISVLQNQLKSRHDDRMKTNAHYQVLLDEISFINQEKSRRFISLNEKKRIAEKAKRENEQLRLLNAKRKANNQTLLTSIDELEEETSKATQKDHTKQIEHDLVVTEGAEILVDFKQLLEQQIADIKHPM
ncbi:MAG: tail-specific protease [Gammaproteobacteria bacterium]|nr:MAG: tail-specific protease [Gammaproteobacteria bacterium]